MTPRQIELVQTSFIAVKANADQAADLFYERLFSVTPELRAMFPADMAEQKKKLMDMLQVAIDNLHRVDVIMPDIKEMGRRHKGYGVT
ncbi:MAG TPA: globin domain-containing protein, partial [Reyranellaceae bacterium]|nr:globin domain-containing protein [Reyranellaceae bacterium]